MTARDMRSSVKNDALADRILKGVAAVVVTAFVVGMVALIFLAARHPGYRGAQECLAQYQRARSAADSAIVDELVPVVGRTKEMTIPTCGVLRRSGELR